MKSPNPGFADLVGLKMVFGLQIDISEDSGEGPGFKQTSFSRRSLSWHSRDLGSDLFHKTWKNGWGPALAPQKYSFEIWARPGPKLALPENGGISPGIHFGAK